MTVEKGKRSVSRIGDCAGNCSGTPTSAPQSSNDQETPFRLYLAGSDAASFLQAVANNSAKMTPSESPSSVIAICSTSIFDAGLLGVFIELE